MTQPGPNPTPIILENYQEACEQIETLQSTEKIPTHPLGRTLLLTHGKRVSRAIVLLHGYTSAPIEFEKLGQRFYQAGYNVLIPRLPHHGLIDRMTDNLAHMDAKELVTFTARMVDIAHGLGEEITVAGLSMSGSLTAWVAQNRTDVNQAVLIAPALGFGPIPAPLTLPFVTVLGWLPNFFRWWNPEKKDLPVGDGYGYPRYASRGLSELMRINYDVRRSAQTQKPLARSILVITNANDHTVNNQMTGRLLREWERSGASIQTYTFPAELNLPHDLIDPGQIGQNIEIIYPILENIIQNQT